jgi:hypothetical protein
MLSHLWRSALADNDNNPEQIDGKKRDIPPNAAGQNSRLTPKIVGQDRKHRGDAENPQPQNISHAIANQIQNICGDQKIESGFHGHGPPRIGDNNGTQKTGGIGIHLKSTILSNLSSATVNGETRNPEVFAEITSHMSLVEALLNRMAPFFAGLQLIAIRHALALRSVPPHAKTDYADD